MESPLISELWWKSHGISTVTVEWNEHEPRQNAHFDRRKILRKRRKGPKFHRNRRKSLQVAIWAKTDFFGELPRVTVENSSVTVEKIRWTPVPLTPGCQGCLNVGRYPLSLREFLVNLRECLLRPVCYPCW